MEHRRRCGVGWRLRDAVREEGLSAAAFRRLRVQTLGTSRAVDAVAPASQDSGGF